MNEIAILSDIHSNLNALQRVLGDIESRNINKLIILGDLIDYGPRHNSTILELQYFLKNKSAIIIKGNHEHALFTDQLSRFSSDRGRESLKLTKESLSDYNLDWLSGLNPSGINLFIGGHYTLLVHGSPQDPYWGKITEETFTQDYYSKYDIILCGHTHKSFSKWHNNTLYLNPGSVGQPRNGDPRAQYMILNQDTLESIQICLDYDIDDEVQYFDLRQNEYYKERLYKGI